MLSQTPCKPYNVLLFFFAARAETIQLILDTNEFRNDIHRRHVTRSTPTLRPGLRLGQPADCMYNVNSQNLILTMSVVAVVS